MQPTQRNVDMRSGAPADAMLMKLYFTVDTSDLDGARTHRSRYRSRSAHTMSALRCVARFSTQICPPLRTPKYSSVLESSPDGAPSAFAELWRVNNYSKRIITLNRNGSRKKLERCKNEMWIKVYIRISVSEYLRLPHVSGQSAPMALYDKMISPTGSLNKRERKFLTCRTVMDSGTFFVVGGSVICKWMHGETSEQTKTIASST